MNKNKTEVIPFKDFMCGLPTTPSKKKVPLRQVYSFLPPITIKSLFPVASDPTFAIFLIAGGSVVVIALAEYLLAESGFTEISDFITGIFKFALPIVGFGLVFWFLTTL